MKKGLLLLSAILALGSLSSSAQRRTATMTDEEMYLDAMHRNITTEKIFGYVKQLSDPALEGRLAGSPGMAKAVDIVKGYFKEWKLIPPEQQILHKTDNLHHPLHVKHSSHKY